MNKKQKDLKRTIDDISKAIRDLERNSGDKNNIKILSLNQKKANLQLKIVTSIFSLSGNTLTKSFYDAIDKRDKKLLRIMLKDSLLVDLTHNEANAMMQRISSSDIEIFDQHDGEEFEKDTSKWNDDYMAGVRVDIYDNFSKERWNHLKQVVKFLRPLSKYSKN